MRDLSRVFQGILFTSKESIITGGGLRVKEGKLTDFSFKEYECSGSGGTSAIVCSATNLLQ